MDYIPQNSQVPPRLPRAEVPQSKETTLNLTFGGSLAVPKIKIFQPRSFPWKTVCRKARFLENVRNGVGVLGCSSRDLPSCRQWASLLDNLHIP